MSMFMEYQKLNQYFNKRTPNDLRQYDPKDGKPINLASGFTTLVNNNFYITGNKDEDNESDIAIKMTLSKNIAQETSGFAYSYPVMTLFDIYNRDSVAVQDFDYREQVYQEFISNLAFMNLRPFVECQLNNDFFSSTHLLYLTETMDLLSGFIEGRRVSNDSWTAMIYHARADYTKVRSELRSILLSGKYKSLLDLPFNDLITCWLNTEYGIADLIFFLKIVFGRPDRGRIQ